MTDYSGTISFEMKDGELVDKTGLFKGMDCSCKKEEMIERGKVTETGLLQSNDVSKEEIDRQCGVLDVVNNNLSGDKPVDKTVSPSGTQENDTKASNTDQIAAHSQEKSATKTETTNNSQSKEGSNNQTAESTNNQPQENNNVQPPPLTENTAPQEKNSEISSLPNNDTTTKPSTDMTTENTAPQQELSKSVPLPNKAAGEYQCPPGFIKTTDFNGSCCESNESIKISENNTYSRNFSNHLKIVGNKSFCCCQTVPQSNSSNTIDTNSKKDLYKNNNDTIINKIVIVRKRARVMNILIDAVVVLNV